MRLREHRQDGRVDGKIHDFYAIGAACGAALIRNCRVQAVFRAPRKPASGLATANSSIKRTAVYRCVGWPSRETGTPIPDSRLTWPPVRRRPWRSRATRANRLESTSRWPNFASTAAVDLAPHPGSPGITVRRIAHQRQIIGNRLRAAHQISAITPASSRSDSGAPVQLHHPRAAHALRQVFVGRADDHPVHARCPRAASFGGGGQSIVGFELHHRPDHDAHSRERILQQLELAEQIRDRSPSPVL